MAKHSKNNTSRSFFTYHERKKIQGHGTIHQRIGAESMRNFEACWLCLRQATNPVCTAQGIIFCKTCIVLSFAEQKRRNKVDEVLHKKECEETKLRNAEKKANQDNRNAEKLISVHNKVLRGEDVKQFEKFNDDEVADLQLTMGPNKPKFLSKDVSDVVAKSFWVVEALPQVPDATLRVPKKGLLCPITHCPLRLKELIELNPEIEDGESDTSTWICPICKKGIIHQPAAVLRTTGQVFTLDCLKKFVIGQKGYYGDRIVAEDDVVSLVAGGTGFTFHNKTESTFWRPVMQ